MADIEFTLPGEDLTKLIEYHPTWPEDYHLFVDEANWLRVRPFYNQLKAALPNTINHVAYGSPVEERPGIRFGSKDLRVEERLAKRIGVEAQAPESDALVSIMEETPVEEVTYRRKIGRPPGPVARGLIPLGTLTKVGHTLMVTGEFSKQSLHKKVRDHCEGTGKSISCLQTKGGVLLVLTHCRPLVYDKVFEL